ncbi:bifunctional hydroxymethylpyrimidine kinase/phosphomethylpyrimidine kinase [Enterovirga rhinocerotis]|uniref:hydroxymethylpyrimidine kinase n=1 Tax=Enterovirga rhinocerotis TaxID=1339210 RepID=A0A4R7C805_9HYPH|nr:bifunctional hydroxymethylpyrimidine kinase/phosphomethylpyrimidine kinase [Enterovirga rhinocerotis]TDR94461.1 hydroxymethylpyrimidine kinase /phosphomethylpyrimidine kinase [Enterovirga rhinocerotis]
MTIIALTIAGSDSGGGAGIQADLKTFSALGAYGASVLTALTAQNTRGVQAIHDVPPDFVAAQIDSVMTDLDVGAVKIGMLSRPETIEAVASGLVRHAARNVVLDPVMVATSGDRLISLDAIDTLRSRLLPLAALVTPNLPEAAELLGTEIAETEDDIAEQGRRLLALGAGAVLIKGGHGSGPESTDILVTAEGTLRLPGPRLETRNTHGTGCTLSSAIAAFLAAGRSLPDAASEAKSYLSDALKASDRLAVGSGSGPVHHFHRWW